MRVNYKIDYNRLDWTPWPICRVVEEHVLRKMELSVSTILPPRVDTEAVPTSIRIPKPLVDEVDVIAKETGYSRSEVLLHFIRYGVEKHKEETASLKRKR